MEPCPRIQILTACETGQHQLQPRHDVHKDGETFVRKYLGEACCRCGTFFERPLSIAELVQAGLIDKAEAGRVLRQRYEADLTAVLLVPSPSSAESS